MSQNNWNEQKIEQLLSQMPKPKDTRSKEDVIQRLQKSIQPSTKPEKKRKYWAPPAVGVAAMITLTLLGVTYINNSSSSDEAASDFMQESASKHADDNSAMTKVAMEEESIEIQADLDNSENATAELMIKEKDMDSVRAAYEEDTQNHTVFQVGLAGDQANSVPITFLIPNEYIQNDFNGKSPSQLELYQQYAPQINEEALGFSEYHPFKGTLKTEGESLIHVLPDNHGYDVASASISLYVNALVDTFDEYNEILFQDEDGSATEFSQVGQPSEPLSLTKDQLMQNYYLFTASDGSKYLTANFGKTYKSITEALNAMKGNPNDVYTSLVPRGINFEVQEEEDLVRITFSEPLELDKLDPIVAMNLIEGILLTGASFQQTIQMDNVVPSSWNGFDFTKPLPKPIGPNKMYFEPIQ